VLYLEEQWKAMKSLEKERGIKTKDSLIRVTGEKTRKIYITEETLLLLHNPALDISCGGKTHNQATGKIYWQSDS
jgi:hypothetical protein